MKKCKKIFQFPSESPEAPMDLNPHFNADLVSKSTFDKIEIPVCVGTGEISTKGTTHRYRTYQPNLKGLPGKKENSGANLALVVFFLQDSRPTKLTAESTSFLCFSPIY